MFSEAFEILKRMIEYSHICNSNKFTIGRTNFLTQSSMHNIRSHYNMSFQTVILLNLLLQIIMKRV